MARPKESLRKDIRSEVVEAAKTIFLEEGLSAVTMRGIARRAGCTAGAIYLYYKNKQEIVDALRNEGFRILLDYKHRVLAAEPSGALERLRLGGRMYLRFALENPEFYGLMFGPPQIPEVGPLSPAKRAGQGEDYAMRSYLFLREGILACQDEGRLLDMDPDLAAYSLWASVHGLASLMLHNRVPFAHEPSLDLAEQAVEFFMKTLAE